MRSRYYPGASRLAVTFFLAIFACGPLAAQRIAPGSRTVMDAHNCYPYFEWWSDRIDRALGRVLCH